MARNAGTFVENAFIQGLVTESSGLNFPEKAVIETWNTRYRKTGEAERRLGIDAEGGVVGTAGTFNAGARRGFVWGNPGKEDYRFLVVQTGRYISFWSYDSSGAFSDGLKAFNIDLVDYSLGNVTNESVRNEPVDFASAEGRLFLVHPYCEPMYVDYDPDTDTIEVTQYEITIRDTEGIIDDTDDYTRVATLSDTHKYNLWNQGWWDRQVYVGKGTNLPIDHFLYYRGVYPNNSELWWYYKDTNKDGDEYYNPTLVDILEIGNTKAPRGYYKYNAFNIDRSGVSGIGGIDSVISYERPRCIAFYASRIWYAGVDDKIYYSQIVENESTYGNCFQRNDPTSESLSDLLDTDGGVVKVLGLGKATGLFSTGTTLYIFSNSGIWAIAGSGVDGTGFVATDFAVKRVSTVNLISSMSLVDVEGVPLWWNLEGIWTIQQNQQGTQVISLTNDTIKTFLSEEVPVQNRPYAQGAYNSSDRTVQWLVRSTATTSVPTSYKYDRLLELNITTGAFYPHKWLLADQELNVIFSVSGLTSASYVQENVTDSSLVNVTDSTAAVVTALTQAGTSFTSTRFKYLNLTTSTFTFFEEIDDTYVDFKSVYPSAGKDFTSYFVSGAKVHAEGRVGTIEYITMFSKAMTDASAKLQVKWDWANSGVTGKWSTPQEIYTTKRSNRDVSHKRLLIRGQGPALQLQVTSVAGKPFTIIGWSSFETVDNTP